jgi:hypothetical protein
MTTQRHQPERHGAIFLSSNIHSVACATINAGALRLRACEHGAVVGHADLEVFELLAQLVDALFAEICNIPS